MWQDEHLSRPSFVTQQMTFTFILSSLNINQDLLAPCAQTSFLQFNRLFAFKWTEIGTPLEFRRLLLFQTISLNSFKDHTASLPHTLSILEPKAFPKRQN